VHGLDLAAGTGQPPWLTGAAAGVVEELMLPADDAAALRQALGWDRATLIAKATGRRPLTAAERQAADSAGLRWLALG
jgi:pimeloyl-ACP methyl ester carboxylesterase